MNLSRLFQKQKELDVHIEQEHPMQEGDRRTYKKVLALLVEIGELANETRCFKFWSHKGPSKRDVILEEGVDVLHFFLSLGNDLGLKPEHIRSIAEKPALETQFLALIDQARLAHIKEQWEWAFVLFVTLMESLGYEWEEVEEAYERKNGINHARQESGY